MRAIAKWVLIAPLMTGCTSTTGILPAGPNTYTVTEHVSVIRGGVDEAQRQALAEASAYCRGQGREMLPIDLRRELPTGGRDVPTDYTATFRCLLRSDPEFHR